MYFEHKSAYFKNNCLPIFYQQSDHLDTICLRIYKKSLTISKAEDLPAEITNLIFQFLKSKNPNLCFSDNSEIDFREETKAGLSKLNVVKIENLVDKNMMQ